jgi:hypothetical protein
LKGKIRNPRLVLLFGKVFEKDWLRLYRNMWGLSNSTLLVQSLDASNSANFAINFYDVNGNLSCGQTHYPGVGDGGLLASQSDRRPRNRLPVQLGDWLCRRVKRNTLIFVKIFPKL